MANPTSKVNLVINGVTTQLDVHDANAVDLNSNQTVGGIKTFSNAPVVGSISLDGKTIDTDANDNMTFNSHIVDTIEEQGNGYIRYSNGIQICWGMFYISGNIVSFPKTFVNNSTALTITRFGAEFYNGWISSITASNFTPVSTNTSGFSWRYIAIGSWK